MTLEQHIAALEKQIGEGLTPPQQDRLKSLAGRIYLACRKTDGADRLKQPQTCPRCQQRVESVRAMRRHRCPAPPAPAA